MTITFSLSANDLVQGAMEDTRLIEPGGTPTANEYAYGIKQLNLLLKSMALDGITPWTDVEGSVAFAANDPEVTLSPRPFDVYSASVQYPTYERPLSRFEQGEYDDLPNKTQAGQPLVYLVVQTTSGIALRLWPVPGEATDVVYRYARVIEDVTVGGDPIDVPQVWLEGIQAMLAIRLTAFGEIPQDALSKAASYRQKLSDMSRPESYMIGPDF